MYKVLKFYKVGNCLFFRFYFFKHWKHLIGTSVKYIGLNTGFSTYSLQNWVSFVPPQIQDQVSAYVWRHTSIGNLLLQWTAKMPTLFNPKRDHTFEISFNNLEHLQNLTRTVVCHWNWATSVKWNEQLIASRCRDNILSFNTLKTFCQQNRQTITKLHVCYKTS